VDTDSADHVNLRSRIQVPAAVDLKTARIESMNLSGLLQEQAQVIQGDTELAPTLLVLDTDACP
jgi:hypothetical protein